MTSTAGVPSFTPILTAASLAFLLATSVVAQEPGRFVPAGRPIPVAPDRGDLPPTVITQSFLDLVDDAAGSEAVRGDNAPPRPRAATTAPAQSRSTSLGIPPASRCSRANAPG